MLSIEDSAPLSRPASSKPNWPTWTLPAVVIASGPSLTPLQLEQVRQHRKNLHVVAVNDVGRKERLPTAAPWADVLYAADTPWWKLYRPDFDGLKVSAEREAVGIADLNLTIVHDPIVHWRPGVVQHGGHSGYQALQMAIGLGSPRVLLLGYDCRMVSGRTNYFGDKDPSIFKPSPYAKWAKGFHQIKPPPDVEIINCTPGSAIDCFPRKELSECLS